MSDITLPLCVDLDETLILNDTFNDGIARLFSERAERLAEVASLLLKGGRPALKAWLAFMFPVDPARLVYRQDLLEYLRGEKAKGRKLYLVSATNQKIVSRIAEHVGIFDGAYGSSDTVNLKGPNKAAFIIKNIGPRFCYAGDSFADLAVWKKAETAILCGWKAIFLRWVRRRGVEAVFLRRPAPYAGSGASQAPRAR